MNRESIKEQLYVIIFGTHTPAGRWFDICLIATILMSLGVLVLDSVPSIHENFTIELKYIEYLFTVLFTLEYMTRLCVHPDH